MMGKATDAAQAMVDVLAERRRQMEVEGWTPKHDDTHDNGELALAAACYALLAAGWKYDAVWPLWSKGWSLGWFKDCDRRRAAVKAAALLVAEIERLDRVAPPVGGVIGDE